MDFKYFNSHLLDKTIKGAKGDYRILALIAAGTGGMVMQGLHDKKKLVAVKYQSSISEDETNLYLKFLENTFSNVVNILDIFKNQSHPGYFIIMDFTDMLLTRYIHGKNEFSDTKSQQFQSMIKQISYGLYELHKIEIIHRDFKPDNIVVKLDNNAAKYMLCDLKLVRSNENESRKRNQFLFCPMFVAPELVNDEQYSVKVDIWALGCMLYSLLARKHLFEGNSVQLTLEQVIKSTQQEIDTKINQIQNIDEEFKYLLKQMIQIKQSDRLSIKQVIEQINKYYENINRQQLGQIQFNNQFLTQQIILNQKPKVLPQLQLKIEYDRIQRSNQIQCEQMKDNLQFKLNELEQLLVLQYNKQGKSYSYQDVQQIIKQTIQAVQSKSFDVIDLLYVVKLELDKKMALEQMGQKDLKYLGHQTELNQKQMEINKNMEKMNNLQEQLKAFEIDKQENDKKIKDLQDQLQQQQNIISQQGQQIQGQLEQIQVLKDLKGSQSTEFKIYKRITQNKQIINIAKG